MPTHKPHNPVYITTSTDSPAGEKQLEPEPLRALVRYTCLIPPCKITEAANRALLRHREHTDLDRLLCGSGSTPCDAST